MITKEKFEAYVSVQRSGITNMFDVRNVIDLAGGKLDKEDCLEIMKTYSELEEKYA